MLPAEVEKAFLKEGYILGIGMTDAERRKNFYFKVLSVEECLYPYSFGAIAAGSSSGWKRPQDASNRYFLDPPQPSLINHFFIGLSPTRAELYLQYPLDRDKGSLVGTRVVGSGIGIFASGRLSPLTQPSSLTELITIHNIDPAFNAYTPVAATVLCNFYAVQYRVSPPLTEITPEEKKRAKVFAIYGKTISPCPGWLVGKGVEA